MTARQGAYPRSMRGYAAAGLLGVLVVALANPISCLSE